MNFDSDQANDILKRLPGMVDDVRGGRVGAPMLVALAAGVFLVLWLGMKVLRVFLKLTSVFAVVTAVAGAVMYFTQRGDTNDADE